MTNTQIAYNTLADILADEPATVENLADPSWVAGPFTGPPAYAVLVTPSDFHIAVAWTARFGETKAVELLNYPVPAEDPQFRSTLTDLVIPLVRGYHQTMQTAKLADYANDAPGDAYTVEDAVRRIGGQ